MYDFNIFVWIIETSSDGEEFFPDNRFLEEPTLTPLLSTQDIVARRLEIEQFQRDLEEEIWEEEIRRRQFLNPYE